MSDRAKKSIGQDAVGVLFCLIGGFFLVSIYLNWRGNEPVYAPATQPVLELVALFGLVPAALLSLGVAAIGAWIFLASLPPVVGRPLAALALGTTGFALILGAFAWGGSLGAVFPGLVDGTVGRLIGAVLGVVVAFLAFTLVAPSGPAASTADVMRAGIGGRNEIASGVSTAEATLLGGEPRPVTRPAARRDEPRRDEPLREETLRPLAPEKARAAAPVARPLEVTPVATAPAAELPRPSAPAWEAEGEEDLDEEAEAVAPAVAQRADEVADEDEADEELAEELAAALHADADAEEDVEDDTEGEEPNAQPASSEPAQAERTPPAASWEQVSLFDEEKEEEAEEPAPAAAPVATGTLDFGEPARASHEPERGNPDDPFASEPVVPAAPPAAALAVPAEVPTEELDEELDEVEHAEEAEELAAELEQDEEADEEADEEELEADEEAAELEEEPALAFEEPAAVAPPAPVRAPAPAAKAEVPAAAPEFVLQPRPAPRAEPAVARDSESEKWQRMVFDSGLLILEQKRVAVSMLERRFGLDFDSACRVLDELQQAGLIGPYIGGRTREILLTKEQWQAQAAETA